MTAVALALALLAVVAGAASSGGQEAVARGSSPQAACQTDVRDADQDGNPLLQLPGSRRKADPRKPTIEDLGSIQDTPLAPPGAYRRDTSEIQHVVDMFFAGKKMAQPGHRCQRTDILSCVDDDMKKMCAEQCGTQEEMLALAEEKAKGRGQSRASRQARNAIVSRIQSMMEQRHTELNGKPLPQNVHDAMMTLDKVLSAIKADATDLGYTLTVVEALLFTFRLTDFVIDIPRDTVTAKVYKAWVYTYILPHGWNSTQAHAYYDTDIKYNEFPLPIDLGWVNEYLGTLGTYVHQKGVHSYRKTPWTVAKGYDFNYSVYELPEKDDKPLVIGLVSDWGTGSPESLQVIKELKQQKPDIVIHLGDTYYSGTPQEAREYFLDPMRAVFGDTRILQVPGNHDYYAEGGKGFFEVADELGFQEASFFALRGKHWQILALDTGLLNDFQLLLPIGPAEVQRAMEATLTFLPHDQIEWALHQLEVGRQRGLKTVVMSHHQLFSRHESMGVANSFVSQSSTVPDRLNLTYFTDEFKTKSEDLPGNLPSGTLPAANTRLLNQFSPEVLEGISAWYWGHEHFHSVFKPYAGLERGRLIGNGALLREKDLDLSAPCEETDGTPWGGMPEEVPGSELGQGSTWWNLAFVTVTLDGKDATARHFQMQDVKRIGRMPEWGPASVFYQETY